MTDKVQKIKDWICREQDCLMDAQGNFENPRDEGAFHILTNLDYYIDSLQEETVVCVPFESVGVPIDKVVSANIPDKKEEPVRDDLRNAANGYAFDLDEGDLNTNRDTFIAGAQWQKQQMLSQAIEMEVKIDAGGYPYIDKVIELYDYDKDEPLAKEGDKVKLIIIKEE